MEISIKGGLGDRQVLRLNEVIQILFLVDALGNDAVIVAKGFLGQGNSGKALDERLPIGFMGKSGQIFMLLKLAAPLALAAITNKGRFQQVWARPRIFYACRNNLYVLLVFFAYRHRVFSDLHGNPLE